MIKVKKKVVKTKEAIKPAPMQKSDMGMALFSLAEQGVTRITIYYSGSGDSGEITDVSPEYISPRKERVDLLKWNEIAKILEDWAYDRLEYEADWCNNDGGEGHIQIQVPSGEYQLHHGVRDITYSDSEGDLKEEDYFND